MYYMHIEYFRKDVPMSKVFICFLGLGRKNDNTGEYRYTPAKYELYGKTSGEYEYIQSAEIELLGSTFDSFVVMTTKKSRSHHENRFRKELKNAGLSTEPVFLELSEQMASEEPWQWFEEFLKPVNTGDELTVDLTHGYRVHPIVYSTAINFLQRAKGIHLNGVFYGAFEQNRELSPIIDITKFYTINEWADGVSRLVDNADAGKLSELAGSDRSSTFEDLNSPEIARAFEELTSAVRNIDLQNIYTKAEAALTLIHEQRKKRGSAMGDLLLEMVYNKFTSLITAGPGEGKYDPPYFLTQLELIKLLNRHKLYMQSYTAIREMITSVGLIPVKRASKRNVTLNNSGGKKARKTKGEVFFNMVSYAESEWRFDESAKEHVDKMLPYYRHLESHGMLPLLETINNLTQDIRNGFDHGWTGINGSNAETRIQENAHQAAEEIEQLIRKLQDNNVFDLDIRTMG